MVFRLIFLQYPDIALDVLFILLFIFLCKIQHSNLLILSDKYYNLHFALLFSLLSMITNWEPLFHNKLTVVNNVQQCAPFLNDLCLLLLLIEGFIQMEVEQNELSCSPKRPLSGSDESVEPSPCKRPRIQEEVCCNMLCIHFY